MIRTVLTATLCCLTASAAAQPSRDLPPLVFDDLSYAAAEWSSQDDRPLSERSVFGLNPWCEGLTCADTVVTRAWYQYLWRENGFQPTDPLSRIEPDTTGTGALGFAMLAGDHVSSWPHQIASGFSAREGVWAARANFSPLPEDGVRMIQAFWLVGSHQTIKPPDLEPYRGSSKGRFEVDFELNNWFGSSDRTELYLSTGIYENSESGTSVPLRANDGAHDYSCTLTDGTGRIRTADPSECAQFLVADGVWTTMLFRSDGESARFELRADGPDGTLQAVSDTERGKIPSQAIVTMLSQHLNGTDDAPDLGRLARDQRVVFDWIYWSPEADRPFDAVRTDVATIQAARIDGRRVTRLRTLPVRLHRPYSNAPGQPYDLQPEVPLHIRIDGPEELDVFRHGTFVSRLDDFVGTFRIAWSHRLVFRDGLIGAWSAPVTEDSHIHRVRMPLQVACIDVRAQVVPMTYTVVRDGERDIVEWVPPETDAEPPFSDVKRACKRWTPSQLRQP